MRQHIASEGVLKAYKRVERTGESHNFEEFDQCLARIAAVDKTDQFMVCLIAKYETPDDRKTPILLIPIRIGIFSNQGFEIYPSADDTYPRVASSAATTNLLQQSYVEGRYDQVKALMQTGEKLRFDFSFPHTQPANVPEIIPGLDFSMAEWKTIIQLDPEIVYQNVDSQQNNMLMRAIICQQFDLALFILQIVGNNICINQKNLENKTALYYMLTNGAWKTIQMRVRS
ncbi:MAG: hypothetical protein HWD59_12535 [Coxiellaceae bacterium]|nr:MAG: hypothetical protein HWD59_12535 [Coxiellaceae bacterium]